MCVVCLRMCARVRDLAKKNSPNTIITEKGRRGKELNGQIKPKNRMALSHNDSCSI